MVEQDVLIPQFVEDRLGVLVRAPARAGRERRVLELRAVQRHELHPVGKAHPVCRPEHHAVSGLEVLLEDLEDAGGSVIDQIEQTAREALSRDRSGAIVLGCAGMTTLCQTLTERLGVPVIDGVAVAVKFAEALAILRLGTSKHGDYATPLPNVYTGWAAPFGWPKR